MEYAQYIWLSKQIWPVWYKDSNKGDNLNVQSSLCCKENLVSANINYQKTNGIIDKEMKTPKLIY
jgi:hypothetical protein